MPVRAARIRANRKAVTLRTVAEYVGLAPCSISAVLNDAPAARNIPLHTRQRIVRAAAKLRYQPNFTARSLRTRRTRSIAVLVGDVDREGVAAALCGIARGTSARGYLLVLSVWDGTPGRHSERVLELKQRGIEGLILIDGPSLPAPDLHTIVLSLADATQKEEATIPRAEAAVHSLLDQIERA